MRIDGNARAYANGDIPFRIDFKRANHHVKLKVAIGFEKPNGATVKPSGVGLKLRNNFHGALFGGPSHRATGKARPKNVVQ